MKLRINKGTILAAVACLGVIGTALTAGHDRMKLEEIMEKEGEFESKKDQVVTTARCYIPTIGVGLATIGCIIASKKVDAKQIAVLGGSCYALTRQRDKLEAELKKAVGEERYSEIKDKVKEACLPKTKKELKKGFGKHSIEDTGKGHDIFMLGYTGRLFYSSREAVEADMKEFNRMVMEQEYVCLNDLYELLGIHETHFGNQYGWPNKEYLWNPDEGLNYEISGPYDDGDLGGLSVSYVELFDYPVESHMEM